MSGNMNLIGFKNNKIVNLNNVSNILFDDDKVIFNMNYSVKVFGERITTDYIYWKFYSEYDKENIKRKIDANTETWIQPLEEGQRYINPASISSIAFRDDKQRIIFNLNSQLSHPKDENKITSNFVFMDITDKEDYKDMTRAILGITQF